MIVMITRRRSRSKIPKGGARKGSDGGGDGGGGGGGGGVRGM